MKLIKILGLASVFTVALVTVALAAMPGSMGSQGMAAVQQMGTAQFFTGTFSGMNDESRQIYVRSEVPGLLGPQEMVLPFNISDNTSLTVCLKSIKECDSSAIGGSEGWNILKTFEDRSDFSVANKNVVVVTNPETGQPVHVMIEYNTL